MHRLIKFLFVLMLLAGQFHLAAHEYEEHADEQSCDVCITLKQLDQATEVSTSTLVIQSSYALVLNKTPTAYSHQHLAYFSVRAPPSLA